MAGGALKRRLAPCGMDCRLCGVFQRQQKPCPGCWEGTENKPKHCQTCEIRHCPILPPSGLCCHCSRYPCPPLKRLDARYRKQYQTSLLANMNEGEQHGWTAFWQRQNKQYACPACGGLLCLHSPACLHCQASNPNWAKPV